MLSRTHFVFAIFVFLMFFKYFNDKLFVFLFLVFATFLVDIDSKKSKIGNHWFLRPFQWFIPHRGIFHSLFFGLLVSYFLFLWNFQAALGFLTGYSLHLILDSVTRQGIKFFWPISSKKIKGFIKSGGLIEEILFVLLLLVDVFLVGKLCWENLF